MINILSLFGGKEAGREVIRKMWMEHRIGYYFSSEFDKYPETLASSNFPDIVHIGDVTKVSFNNGKLFFNDCESCAVPKIDFLIGWPPCQDLSIAGKREGLEWSRSSLFWEFVRILNETKPEFFFMENVASMPKEAFDTISQALWFEWVKRNAARVSAQNRKRIYWLGKRNDDGTYSRFETPEPEDRGIVLRDILEDIPLDDPRWKPLPEKYIEIVKSKLDKFSTDRKAFSITATYANACVQDHLKHNRTVLINIPRGSNKWCVCEDKTHALTKSQYVYNNQVVGQFRRANLRVHSEQEKAPTLTANMGTWGNNTPICIKLGFIGSDSQWNRIYSTEWKSATLSASTWGLAWKSGSLILNEDIFWMIPNNVFELNKEAFWLAHRNRWEGKEPECNGMEKANAITSVQTDSEVLVKTNEPKYLWRKLTVRECSRLQGFSEQYIYESVSASRAYKAIGNSWQCDEVEEFWKHIPFFQ